jgi:hypothetical protein
MTQLFITNGTATVNLIWHSVANRKYLLTRGDWAPTIPALRTSELALGGPYADVQEEIGVNVYGQTIAECLSNLETLTYLLDQADRWNPKRGENVAAVRLQYMPTGGTLLLESVIIGRAGGDETSGVRLPPTFNRDLGAFVIENVRIRFWRRGLLINPAFETAGTSTSQDNPFVQTITFASNLTVPSPLKLTTEFRKTGGGATTTGQTDRAVLLTARAANRLQIYEAESATTLGTNVAVQADAANKARGGSVARYSPGSLTSNIAQNIGTFDTSCRRLSVWACVRNNSATTTFTIQVTAGDTTPGVAARVVTIDTSSLLPRIVHLGIISTRIANNVLNLLLTASAASGSLDIDYFVIQAIDDETSGALVLTSQTFGPVANPTTVDPRALESPLPLVTTSSPAVVVSPEGDAFLVSRGQVVAVAWLGTSSNYWRIVDSANLLLETDLEGYRYNAYLTPR